MDVNEARDTANAALAGLTADVAEGLTLDDEGVCRGVHRPASTPRLTGARAET